MRRDAYLSKFADEWEGRGVRAWHEGWWTIGAETGNLLAPILGVHNDTITMHQNATVAQSIVASCFAFDGRRRKIVMQDLDFPTNHYLFEGLRRYGADIVYVPSEDSIRAPIDRLVEAVDDETALVPMSLCCFAVVVSRTWRRWSRRLIVSARASSSMYQAPARSMNLDALAVDFAVGGSVKWLCGGPGYLGVRPTSSTSFGPPPWVGGPPRSA
jgi:kynureninase